MSRTEATLTDTPSRPIAGIISIEIGMLFFVLQDAMMKALLGDFTVWMLISARACVALLVLVPTIKMLGAPHRLFSPLWHLHLLRAGLFAFGFSLFYTAFPFMGLAEVTTIFFAAPLFTAIFAVLFLRETIGWQRLACLLIGFAGVIIAMNPTGDSFQWVAVLPLICAISYALSQILARQIGEKDTTVTMGLYTIVFAGILVLPMGYGINQLFDLGQDFRHLRWDWAWPDPSSLGYLALLGVFGMCGYMLITRAYQVASASLIAPFDYSYLPLAATMAYFVWNEVPGWNTIVGMILIVCSGIYLGYREIVNARKNASLTPTGETTFVPGAPSTGPDSDANP
ncbi:MAG: DMT family transporter [Pseudomonadota bacterium]